jgi:Ser/Thr protein kinase RdoA (MazF antagonist)
VGGEYTPEVLADLEARVRRDLGRWGLSPGAQVSLLNVSENATFALCEPQGRELVLRVHRVGYSSAEEIRSELAWMSALRTEGIVDGAAPVSGADGAFVQVLEPLEGEPPEGNKRLRGASPRRFAVAFERLPGREPEARDAVQWFERLGEITARMHVHSRSWVLPEGFRRKRWDFDAMVGERGFWGPWRAAIGLDDKGIIVLERALEKLKTRLGHIGESAEVFGLVHADLRLANLLVDGHHLRVIDFDDCGFSWYLYDFATAVSFIEHEPVVPTLLRSWLAGYRRTLGLSDEAAADIPGFVILRRILLTAWLASHAEVPFAREFGADYTRGTVHLAQAWLDGDFLKSAFC